VIFTTGPVQSSAVMVSNAPPFFTAQRPCGRTDSPTPASSRERSFRRTVPNHRPGRGGSVDGARHVDRDRQRLESRRAGWQEDVLPGRSGECYSVIRIQRRAARQRAIISGPDWSVMPRAGRGVSTHEAGVPVPANIPVWNKEPRLLPFRNNWRLSLTGRGPDSIGCRVSRHGDIDEKSNNRWWMRLP